MPLRLVALDLDGTLLDPYGRMQEPVCDAVASLRRAGLEVVLCTGRRFRTALPMAQRLALDGPIVTNNGVLVKDIGTGKTLQHDYLAAGLFAEVLALMRTAGPPLVYVDSYHEDLDLVTERIETAHPFQQRYLADNTAFSRVVADLAAEALGEAVIMMSAMADLESLMRLQKQAVETLGARVFTHSLINKNYDGHILEFLSPTSGKWSALRKVAAEHGIEPDEIAAIGDDNNDAEMIRHAGLGIAMGNAVPEARAAARHVVRSNAEGGAVEAIQHLLAVR